MKRAPELKAGKPAERSVYATKDGRLVEEDDPEANTLVVGKGGVVSQKVAARYAGAAGVAGAAAPAEPAEPAEPEPAEEPAEEPGAEPAEEPGAEPAEPEPKPHARRGR